MADTCDLQNVEEDFAQPESESQQEPHVPQSTPKLDAVSESLLDLEFNQTAMSTGSIGMQKHGTPSETEVTIQPCEDQIQQCDSAGEKEDEAVDEADSDKDTVGDDRCSDREDVDDDEELFDTKRQPDTARHYSISSLVEADGPGLYNSSSIDSLDLLAAANRQLLRQDPGNLDESLANDQSSEDFSDLVPNSSDRFGTSDSESLSSSLLDFAVAGQTSRRPSIRWINLIDENASVVFGSSTSVCGVCARKVYPMEMVTTNGVAYHKFCCKCAKCYRVLSLGNFGVLAGVIYCQTHYTEAVRLRDAPFDKKSANSENSEPPETSDPIRGWLKRRTSLADEQPPPGISKNILNFFHGLEQQQQQSSVQKEQKYPPLPQQQEQQPAVNNRLSVCTDESATPKLISPTSPAPPAAAPFVETSCPPQQSSEDSAEASPDTNNDCLPGQGTAKALPNLWRQKEAVGAGGESITDTGASVGCRERRGSLVKTSGSTATEVKPSNISRSASNLSRPKPAHIVPPPQPLPPPEHQQEQQQEQQEQQQQQDQEQQQKQQQQEQQEQQPDSSQDEGELPPANNTKSMLRLWRQFDQLGGPAPNPESFERLRYQQRSFRLPKRTVDERENVDPIQTSRQDQDQLLETTGELPPEGTTKNLRALFSS